MVGQIPPSMRANEYTSKPIFRLLKMANISTTILFSYMRIHRKSTALGPIGLTKL